MKLISPVLRTSKVSQLQIGGASGRCDRDGFARAARGIKLWLNDELKQDSTTEFLNYDIPG